MLSAGKNILYTTVIICNITREGMSERFMDNSMFLSRLVLKWAEHVDRMGEANAIITKPSIASASLVKKARLIQGNLA